MDITPAEWPKGKRRKRDLAARCVLLKDDFSLRARLVVILILPSPYDEWAVYAGKRAISLNGHLFCQTTQMSGVRLLADELEGTVSLVVRGGYAKRRDVCVYSTPSQKFT